MAQEDYRSDISETIEELIGDAVKIGAILVGVYGIENDYQAIPTIFGTTIIYLAGAMMKNTSRNLRDARRFSNLEDNLKEKE